MWQSAHDAIEASSSTMVIANMEVEKMGCYHMKLSYSTQSTQSVYKKRKGTKELVQHGSGIAQCPAHTGHSEPDLLLARPLVPCSHGSPSFIDEWSYMHVESVCASQFGSCNPDIAALCTSSRS